jgi:hypothetical protein
MANSPTTSVAELRGLQMAIAACFALQREICSSVLLAFFDSIDPSLTWAPQISAPQIAGQLDLLARWCTQPNWEWRAECKQYYRSQRSCLCL